MTASHNKRSRGRGLPEYLQKYLQSEIRAWLATDPSRTGEDLGKRAGVSGAQISIVKNHGRGAGWDTAEGMALVLGITLDELKKRAHEAWQTRSPPPRLQLVREGDGLANGEMAGWHEAEAKVRAQTGLPDWAFEVARRRTGLVPRDGVTPQYVADEAMEVLRYASPDIVIQRTNEELDRKVNAMRKRKRKRTSEPNEPK